MMKQYFLRLLEQGDTEEEQEAIEAAVINNWMHMSYQLKEDQRKIEEQKPEFLDWYQNGKKRKVTPVLGKGAAKRRTAVSRRRVEVRREKAEVRSKRMRSSEK